MTVSIKVGNISSMKMPLVAFGYIFAQTNAKDQLGQVCLLAFSASAKGQ
jgi:hypothetical protein